MKKNIRKVHVNNEEWHYSIGSGGTATIYAPNSKVPIKLDGKDWHRVNSTQHVNDYDQTYYTITPATVKQYIIDHLVEKRLREGIA